MIADKEMIIRLKIIRGARIAIIGEKMKEQTIVIHVTEIIETEEIERIANLAILLIMIAGSRPLMTDMTESLRDIEKTQEHPHLIKIVKIIETIKTRMTDPEEDTRRIAEIKTDIDQEQDQKTLEIKNAMIVIQGDRPELSIVGMKEDLKAKKENMIKTIKIERKKKNKILPKEEVSIVKLTAQILIEIEMIIELSQMIENNPKQIITKENIDQKKQNMIKNIEQVKIIMKKHLYNKKERENQAKAQPLTK